MLSSAANALRALEYLVECGEAGVSDIGRHLAVTTGTAYRLIATLTETGFAQQNPDNRRYRPSPKVARLARHVREHVDAHEVLHHHLARLAAEVRETVNLGVLDGVDVLYVDKVMSDQLFGIEARVGSKLPAVDTALGTAILAAASPEEVQRAMRAVAESADGRTDMASLRRRLASVAERGVAEDLGVGFSDIFCVGAAVRGAAGTAIAAISVSVPRSRFEGARDRIAAAVVATTAAASRDMADLGVTMLPMNGL